MQSLAKVSCLIGILAAAALSVSAADARSVNRGRFAGAYGSVSAPSLPGSTHYRAEGNPFPRGHGGTSASPDFQLMR